MLPLLIYYLRLINSLISCYYSMMILIVIVILKLIVLLHTLNNLCVIILKYSSWNYWCIKRTYLSFLLFIWILYGIWWCWTSQFLNARCIWGPRWWSLKQVKRELSIHLLWAFRLFTRVLLIKFLNWMIIASICSYVHGTLIRKIW